MEGMHWGPGNASRDQRVSDLPLQALSTNVIASAAERKFSPHRTANCHPPKQTFQTVTKVDMTISAPKGASQPMNLAPPNGH
jgi:hypothetical protein